MTEPESYEVAGSDLLDNGDDGGGHSFDQLCLPHYGALVSYAMRLAFTNQQGACDIVQEAYLRAVRGWPRWSPTPGEEPAKAARGWLHTIVQNVFLDRVRASTNHAHLLAEHHQQVLLNTYGHDEDFTMQPGLEDIGDEVKEALDQLEPSQRAVVIRADFQGEQYLQIADALSIPIGTVMSRLHRGRKRLATILEAYAKSEYGIEKGARPRRLARGTESEVTQDWEDDVTLVRELDSASEGTAAFESPQPPQAEAYTVDGVMAWDDSGDLL